MLPRRPAAAARTTLCDCGSCDELRRILRPSRRSFNDTALRTRRLPQELTPVRDVAGKRSRRFDQQERSHHATSFTSLVASQTEVADCSGVASMRQRWRLLNAARSTASGKPARKLAVRSDCVVMSKTAVPSQHTISTQAWGCWMRGEPRQKSGFPSA